jgi:hypothetical protein
LGRDCVALCGAGDVSVPGSRTPSCATPAGGYSRTNLKRRPPGPS